jgi:ABC-type nitrate/sulfonate/bicarbonate transport system permease component
MIENGSYWTHLSASLVRIGVGFLAGGSIGLLAGFLLGQFASIRRVFEPLIVAFYTIPKLSILPLLLLIFGIGEETKILMVGLSVVFVVLINTMAAVASVPSGYLDAARSFEASRWETTWYVLLPAALPQVFVGLRIGWGMAVITIVGAEFVAAKAGIGFLVWNSWNLGIPQGMYIGILTISIVGVCGNAVINLAQAAVTPWSRTTR